MVTQLVHGNLGFMVHASRFTVDEKVEKKEWMLCEPDEKAGRFLLQEIMLAATLDNQGKMGRSAIHSVVG